MVAGKELSPRDVKNTQQLRRYWTRGMGAAKINWGTEGDFRRCVLNLRRHLKDPEGYCAELHHEVMGFWPGDRRNTGGKKKR